MKHNWDREELEQNWTLSVQEQKLLKHKIGATRLGFALLMKFFQMEGRFPDNPGEVPRDVISFVANQLGTSNKVRRNYSWDGREAKYQRGVIREFYGYRKATRQDTCDLIKWLQDEVLQKEHRLDRLQLAVLERFQKLHIEPPTTDQILRLLQSSLTEHENCFCEGIGGSFDAALMRRLDILLQPQSENEGDWTVWQTFKSDPGKAGLESVKEAVARLQNVREIGLPDDILKSVPSKLLERYAKRAAVEEPFELRRHASSLRATLMAAFLHRRKEELTDHLVDLLVETVHKMGKKAENRIEERIDHGYAGDFKSAAARYESALAIALVR